MWNYKKRNRHLKYRYEAEPTEDWPAYAVVILIFVALMYFGLGIIWILVK